jgi:LemA protein
VLVFRLYINDARFWRYYFCGLLTGTALAAASVWGLQTQLESRITPGNCTDAKLKPSGKLLIEVAGLSPSDGSNVIVTNAVQDTRLISLTCPLLSGPRIQMKGTIMIEWSALTGITALIVYAIVIYNRLVRDRQHTHAGWSDIEVQLKRRHDLIPKLVDAVKQYAAYEQATLDQVTALRSRASDMQAATQQGQLETDINQGLVSIFALQEAYPELKANQSFLQLQTDISNVEAEIQFARRYYNGAVRNLNTRIETFPDLLVARMFAYQPAQYFELEATQQ